MKNFLTEPVWCDDREARNRVQVPRWEWWVENVGVYVICVAIVAAFVLFARWLHLP